MTTTPTVPRFDCFDVPDALTPLEVARARILAGLPTPSARTTLALADAHRAVLADDIVATSPVPPADNSAMDGFAVSSVDFAESGEVELINTGLSLAGKPAGVQVRSGECVQIMTGAAMPAGADSVVPQEAAVVDPNGRVRIAADQRAGQNVRRAGEDINTGDVVLKRGHRLGAAELGVLASTGNGAVSVWRALRIAVVSTGDELRDAGDGTPSDTSGGPTPGHHLIYDSNRPILRALTGQLGAIVTDLGILNDDEDVVRDTLAAASKTHDVIITSGGVSTGVADYVSRTVESLGQLGVWRIALRPGRPFAHGRIGDCEFFGLPGNPVAVMVTFDQLVRPALRRLGGEDPVAPPFRFRVRSTTDLRKKPNRTELYRAVLSRGTDGELEVTSTGAQGSGLLTSMTVANCFIIRDHNDGPVNAGDPVDVIPFDTMG